MVLNRFVIFFIFLAVINSISQSQEKSEWKKYFDEYDVKGSFVLYDSGNDRFAYYDSSRCAKGFIPASTFKIPNSIIGLETGVIPDENYVIKWDGIKRSIEAWNHDLDMKSAILVSAVPYYQELARRVGEDRMKEMVRLLNYGNTDISGGIDKFWLEGSLRISQFEQIAFLRKLYNNELPFSMRSMEITKKILPSEDTLGFRIHAKTGYGNQDDKDIGWWVGWAEKNDNVYFFAINIESDNPGSSFFDARKSITRNILNDFITK
jgi:beta-lactamase class D